MNDDAQDLAPYIIPSLVGMLTYLEKQKGEDLTREEVLDVRDRAVAIILSKKDRKKLDEARGYRDFNPENIWEEWCAYKNA
ncbi:MAG: hypothetical protein C0514_02120 [Candidatus Puniceispirillum sp.]|nr:hypothetical protein [Candidatus Puniceispirillum sp.]